MSWKLEPSVTFDLKQSVSILESYKLEVIPPQKFKNDPKGQQWGLKNQRQQWTMIEYILCILKIDHYSKHFYTERWPQELSFCTNLTNEAQLESIAS